jgi:DsbC/DsbD-like thiol-disulfide interchange protein
MKWLTVLMIALLSACGKSVDPGAKLSAEAKLICDAQAVRPGVPFRIGVHIRMPPGSHIYWRNPGDVGLPTEVAWRAPDGFDVGPTQWPVPARFGDSVLMSHGYADEVVLWARVSPPQSLEGVETVAISARADWLLCREVCVPGGADVSLTLPLVESDRPLSPEAAKLDYFERLVPREPPDWRFEFEEESDAVLLRAYPPPQMTTDEMSQIVFIPVQNDLTEPAARQQWSRDGGAYVLKLPKTLRRLPVAERLDGVLLRGDGYPAAADAWFCRVVAQRKSETATDKAVNADGEIENDFGRKVQ